MNASVDVLNTDVDQLIVKTTNQTHVENLTNFNCELQADKIVSNGDLYVVGTSQFHNDIAVNTISPFDANTSIVLNDIVNISKNYLTVSKPLSINDIGSAIDTDLNIGIGNSGYLNIGSNLSTTAIKSSIINIGSDVQLNQINIGNSLSSINFYGQINSFDLFGYRTENGFLNQLS